MFEIWKIFTQAYCTVMFYKSSLQAKEHEPNNFHWPLNMVHPEIFNAIDILKY